MVVRALVAGVGGLPEADVGEEDLADGAGAGFGPLPSVGPAVERLCTALAEVGVDVTGGPLVEPDRTQLRQRWWQLRSDASTSALIVHFAGHGFRAANGGLYLATAGADTGPLLVDRTCVSLKQLLDESENGTQPVLFLLDVCRAGQGVAQQRLDDLAVHRPQGGTRKAWIVGASTADSSAYAARFTTATATVLKNLAGGLVDLTYAVEYMDVDLLAVAVDQELRRVAQAGGHPLQQVVRTAHDEATVDPQPFLRNPLFGRLTPDPARTAQPARAQDQTPDIGTATDAAEAAGTAPATATTPAAPATPAPPVAATAPEPDAALRGYLAWVCEEARRIPVRGLHHAPGLVEVELDRVYVALKVDSSSVVERAAAREALLREIEERLRELDAQPEEAELHRWQLLGDLPVADYFGTADRLAAHRVEQPTVLTVDELHRHERTAVVLGDPGSGKTTVMRWLALVHATALLEGADTVTVPPAHQEVTGPGGAEVTLGPPLLPVLLRVGEYALDRQNRAAAGLPPRGLADFLGHHSWDGRRPVWPSDADAHLADRPLPAEVVAGLLLDALRAGRALVLLDGLDEVAPQVREDTSAAVAEFIRSWAGGGTGRPANRVYVSSRIAGYHLAPLPHDLPQVTVEHMTDRALRVFVHRWTAGIAEAVAAGGRPGGLLPDSAEAAEAAAEALLTLLAEPGHRHVRELASNPLLASVIVSVFLNGGGRLPTQRVEVFHEAAEALVHVWSRRLGGRFSGLLYQTMLAALPAVAAHIHATKPNGAVSVAEFRTELLRETARIDGTDPGRPTPALRDRVTSLLDIMSTEVGLLVASGPDAFRFSHQTFQEFFAARHLCADPAERLARFRARLGDPRWREPILMGLALVDWEDSGLVGLVRDLLAAGEAPTGLFPETALLLATAVLQIPDAPAQAVRLVVDGLLDGYALGAEGDAARLAGSRKPVEDAVAALRASGHRAAVDAALVDALTDTPAGGRSPAPAAAGVVRAVGAASPALAEALIAAADRWDRPEHGHPVTAALNGMMPWPADTTKPDTTKPDTTAPDTPAPDTTEPDTTKPGTAAPDTAASRLPAGWRSGRLRMRELLQRSPAAARRVATDPRWQALVLCLYGGQPDRGAAAALDEYDRTANFLGLPNELREEFAHWFGERWGFDDPVYQMAVYLDSADLSSRWRPPPAFTVDAISRDSPLTRWIGHELQRDDLAGLTSFLRLHRRSARPREAADAALALWALGEDQAAFLADGSAAAELASRRISALGVQLRDATVRAAPRAVAALTAAADVLPPEPWQELRRALSATLVDAGAAPVGFAQPSELPAPVQVGVLAEEFTLRLLGTGDEYLYNAAVFADGVDSRRFDAARLVTALRTRDTTPTAGYRRFHHWWPADPLLFPDDRDPVPLDVLDQTMRIPAALSFAPLWIFRDILAPLIDGQPVRPETLTAAWFSAHRRNGDEAEILTRLDPDLLAAPDPYRHLLGLAERVDDPWYRARALLRLAEAFPAHRPRLAAAAETAAGLVTEPLHAYRLAERTALLAPPEERADRIAACRRLALALADPADAARALLRTARFLAAPDCDDPAVEAVGRAADADPRVRRALLDRAEAEFGDRPAVRAALLRADRPSPGEPDAATGPDRVLAAHLPALVGTDPEAVQVWTPVVLYARTRGALAHRRAQEVRAAWARLAQSPDEAAVTGVTAVHGYDLIDCDGAAARALTTAVDDPSAADLDPVLTRLVRLHCEAEPLVTGWLAHPVPRLRQVAALLLAEYRPPDATTLPRVVELLTDEDDLLRGRARRCLDSLLDRSSTHDSVTRLGVAPLEELGRLVETARTVEPAVGNLVSWHLDGVLLDDLDAFHRWCDAVEAQGPDAGTASYLLRQLRTVHDRVWPALLRRLADGGPELVVVLVEACARTTNIRPGSAETGLRPDSTRWRQLHAVLARVDRTGPAARRILTVTPAVVLAAAAAALRATDGVLDATSVQRASAALRGAAGTDLATLLAEPDPAVLHGRLAAFGAQFYVPSDEAADALKAYHEATAGPTERHWPWLALLVDWTTRLLGESVLDEPGQAERSHLLVVLHAAALTNSDTLRQLPAAGTLGPRAADALAFHNSFPGRAAAAELLGLLRTGSGPVLDALWRGIGDVPAVRTAALRAFGALRAVDDTVVDELAEALTGPSSTAAWSAAHLLSALGSRPTTSPQVRDRIIDLLSRAARDPRSRRTVYLSYVATPIPALPQLDVVIAEALRRVYRIG